jgi:sulfotransferase family protein
VAGGNGFVDQASGTAVLIAGSGRSGTTWLQELINHRRDHRVIFEPFTRAVVPFCSHFNWRQYIREADDAPRFLDPTRRILSGDFRNDWTDQYNQRKVYKKRLVKDIRGLLLLRWLHGRFPEIPIVYIMRHPCAVIASQLRMDWHLNVNLLLEQGELVADFLKPYEYLMRRALINLDHLTLIWCVENYVPLRQFRSGEILLVFYEELLQNPEREVERIFRFIGQPLQPGAFKQYRRQSAEAREWSAILTGDDLLNSWRKYLDAFQISRILYFVGLFGLRRIYGEDSMPHAEAAWT